MSPDNFSQMVPHAHAAVSHAVTHVAPHVKHVVHHVTPIINKGPSMLITVISSFSSAAVAGVIGYFVGKRGLTGTKTDLMNAQAAVSHAASTVTTVADEVKAAL